MNQVNRGIDRGEKGRAMSAGVPGERYEREMTEQEGCMNRAGQGISEAKQGLEKLLRSLAVEGSEVNDPLRRALQQVIKAEKELTRWVNSNKK